MDVRIAAIPRSGPKVATTRPEFPLAGSAAVWFDEVILHHPNGGIETCAGSDLSEEQITRISTTRPDICGCRLDRPNVMGIVNVTPDSFSDGGDRLNVAAAVRAAQSMTGADILDIGGESTRPGADYVPDAEEIRRVVPVIKAIREAGITTPISIDTRKASVAAASLEAGADLVNDISAGHFDAAMFSLVAEKSVPVCLMHSPPDPKTMQNDPHYDDVCREVYDALEERIEAALASGIPRENIIADPGIGFGKTLEHNLDLLGGFSLFHSLGVPLLLGASRKRFIGTIGHAEAAKDRMPGSVAVGLHGALHGAHILRVHDVAETRQALDIWNALALNGKNFK